MTITEMTTQFAKFSQDMIADHGKDVVISNQDMKASFKLIHRDIQF